MTPQISSEILDTLRCTSANQTDSGWGWSGGWLALDNGESLWVAAYSTAVDTIYSVGPFNTDENEERYTTTSYDKARYYLACALNSAGQSSFILPEVI